MFSDKVAKLVQEALNLSTPVYYIDQIPSFSEIKNNQGIVAWDIDVVSPLHCSEGIEYTTANVVLNFELTITIYARSMGVRNAIEKSVLDILQHVVSNKRKPLISTQFTNGFVRYCVWTNTTEFPVPKTAQHIPEMSASVILFDCSISITE